MTAHQEGANQPHHHVVDPAALDLATGVAMAHLTACAVYTLAYFAVQQRGSELHALGRIESTTDCNRDRPYAEIRIL